VVVEGGSLLADCDTGTAASGRKSGVSWGKDKIVTVRVEGFIDSGFPEEGAEGSERVFVSF
jgi:hypothetical protein